MNIDLLKQNSYQKYNEKYVINTHNIIIIIILTIIPFWQ